MNKTSYRHEQYLPNNGGARWADPAELKNAPTVRQITVGAEPCLGCGLPIISDGRTIYVDNSDTHSLILGSTGSKKTRLFGMPLINLFAMAGESFIATDPKGELYQKTSGLVAAKGYNTIVLNFRDLQSSALWNPLILPYELYHGGKTDEAISMLNDFTNALSEPQRKGAKDPYWIEMAHSMALAYLLFFIDTATKEEANIYNYAHFFATNSSPDATEEISRHVAEGSIAHVQLRGVLTNKEAKTTFGNVASGVSNMINPFIIRKTLCQVLSSSSFDVRKIGVERTGIYIIVPDEKTTLHFLVTAFIKQTYEALIHEAQQFKDAKLPVRLNLLLDEFCNIPAIPDMASMISAARSRNMRFFLMVQGLYQLKQKYGDDAVTIMGNCENIAFLNSREYNLLKEVSNLCGDTFYHDQDGSLRSRPLISIAELQRLDKEKGEALILHSRQYPFVSALADIGAYQFVSFPPAKTRETPLPQMVVYKPDNVISEIKNKRRPLPFSVEAFGCETYYNNEQVVKNEIFDW